MSEIDYVTLILIAGALFFIIGAVFKWKIVIDPPTRLWYIYPQAAFRALLRPPELRIFTIILWCFGLFLYIIVWWDLEW